MAGRIRSIHYEQWQDEEFVSLTPLARLLAIALRNIADDQGAFVWKPRGIKMRLLPADACDIGALLDELIGGKQILQYEVEGRIYGYIRNFERFQRPRKPQIVHPAPPFKSVKPAPNSPKCSTSESDGGESRVEESRKDAIASKSAKVDSVDQDIHEFIAASGLLVDAARELARFHDWKLAKGKTFRNDRAAFRNWLRKAHEIAPSKPAASEAMPGSEPWEQRLAAYRKNGFWRPTHWGPEPGKPECRVPPKLLMAAA